MVTGITFFINLYNPAVNLSALLRFLRGYDASQQEGWIPFGST
jgi:hypothetical protein